MDRWNNDVATGADDLFDWGTSFSSICRVLHDQPSGVGAPGGLQEGPGTHPETSSVPTGDQAKNYDVFFLKKLKHLYASLHPYQRELFRSAVLQDSLVYLQTGGGKTWVAATLACYHLTLHPHKKVFFAACNKALVQQQVNLFQQLLQVPVACVVGGAKQFKNPDALLDGKEFRVAVFSDTILFRWLGHYPRILGEKLVSLLILDEVHHATAGAYKDICEQIHSTRDGCSFPMTTESKQMLLESVGLRTPSSSVLAAKLQLAVEEESSLREARLAASKDHTVEFGTAAAAGGRKDGIGDQIASPVLEAMLAYPPLDLPLPQLVGLSASPVIRFENAETELVKVLMATRCRVVSVVDELHDLQQHLPRPALLAMSFLPLYVERVLQAQLQNIMIALFRRIDALISRAATQDPLQTLRETPVTSPGFRSICDGFINGTLMSDRFKATLRLPERGALRKKVEKYRIARQRARPDVQQAHDMHQTGSTSASSVSSSSASNFERLLTSELTRQEEVDLCADFILNAVTLLKCVSQMLIYLGEGSLGQMIRVLPATYPKDLLDRMGSTTLPITAVELRPFLESLFYLVDAVGAKLQAISKEVQYNASSAQPPKTASERLGAPLSNRQLSVQAIPAGINSLPESLHAHSTRTQVLMRVLGELALVARVMKSTPGDTHHHALRVLAFVSTRETATYLMGVLANDCRSIYDVLQPCVLLGQAGGQSSVANGMTKAQQVAVLDSLREGKTSLVFATSIAEEGIDVPACHVVIRCNPQTELRSIVQCCGRLRMPRTLFISLSNLLNSHPRLRFIVDAIRSTDRLLLGLGRRSTKDSWRLVDDMLVNGGSCSEDSFGWDDCGDTHGISSPRSAWGRPSRLGVNTAVRLPVNPNEQERLTWQESSLVNRKRDILQELQRKYHAEVYCIVRRDIALSDLSEHQCDLIMSIPLAESDRERCASGEGAPGRLVSFGAEWSPSDRMEQDAFLRLQPFDFIQKRPGWVNIVGSGRGGEIKAHKRAFVNFCQEATEKGVLLPGGKLSSNVPFEPLSTVGNGGGVRASRDLFAPLAPETRLPSILPAVSSPLLAPFAHALIPSVIFLGESLCLCRRLAWPPAVLLQLRSEQASVMREYNHDMWSSRISPSKLLSGELKAIDMPAPEFAFMSTAHREAVRQMSDEDDDESRSTSFSSARGFLPSADSRDWYHEIRRRQGGESGLHNETIKEAEVRFFMPLKLTETIAASPPARNSSLALSSDLVRRECCKIETRDKVRDKRSKTGEIEKLPVREVIISYRGLHAVQMISLAALGALGVYIVAGVERGWLLSFLMTQRRISSLSE